MSVALIGEIFHFAYWGHHSNLFKSLMNFYSFLASFYSKNCLV